MSSRIPKSFIDDVVNRVDIVELIDERVPLKKAGRDYIACCPFHEEKTPSFSVSPIKQFYYCFGCGAHGSVVGFLMDYGHLEFVEAIEELARRAGMEVPREVSEFGAKTDLKALYTVLNSTADFFSRQLREHEAATRASNYLKSRGMIGQTAKRFHLGYAPPGWNNLTTQLSRGPYSQKTLIQAGLLIDKDQGRSYDRFRDRITFPIRNRRGQVIGFGARSLGDEKPKYLNSPETSVFHKGKELYGLFEAQAANRTLKKLFVVEGYMDVVSLFQEGVTNAVATLGTAATQEHMLRLFRTTPNIIFCFDGDKAGRRAAWRALETLLPVLKDGWVASFMFLPDGEDPDSIAMTKGGQHFLQIAKDSVNLSTFLFDTLEAQVDLNSLEGRARLVDLARPLLTTLTAQAFKNLALQKLVQISGMESTELARIMGGEERVFRPKMAVHDRETRKSRKPSLVRTAMSLVLYQPSLGTLVSDTKQLKDLDMPGVELLVGLLDLLKSNPTMSTGAIIESFRSHKYGKHIAKLATESPPVLEEGLEREFTDAIQKLEAMVWDRRLEVLMAKAKTDKLDDAEEEEFKRLLQRPSDGIDT